MHHLYGSVDKTNHSMNLSSTIKSIQDIMRKDDELIVSSYFNND